MKQEKDIRKKVVCIGGGTGTFVVLKGLKLFPVHLSAIVTMSDSGGSNKRIRDEFGLLPTSDIRQCLVALSDENGGAGLLRQLFMYRFEKGEGISGMTFGNLFMAALSDILGSQNEAIRQTGRVLRIRGQVIPVSLTRTNLYATYEDGHVIAEEHLIDEPPHDGKLKITKVTLKPKAIPNPEALEAIKSADVLVLGPGDLYTSLVPNLLVSGISEAIGASKSKKIYISNLMTKWGQTYNFTTLDHVQVIESFIGPCIDYVFVHKGPLDADALSVYKKSHEFPVVDNLEANLSYRVVRANLASRGITEKPASDPLVRSLIRHDSVRLAENIIKILTNRI